MGELKTINKSIRGGVAIAIKTHWANNITKTTRYSSRSMEIQLNNENTPIANIINTYTPDMSYSDETPQNWDETREIMWKIPKNNVICRRADNNGQLAQDDENNEKVGKWTIGNKTEEGNGKQLEGVRKEHNLIRSNTYSKPRREKRRIIYAV